MSKSDVARLITGEPIKSIVRVKLNQSYQKEDIKVAGSTISLVDSSNRLLEEFEANEVYTPEYGVQNIFNASLTSYLQAFIEGYNVSFLSFGSNGSGKTYVMEGGPREPGLILIFADSLFHLMEQKRVRSQQSQMGKIRDFSYSIRAQYFEVVDEDITDLMVGFTGPSGLRVEYNEWEGPVVSGCTWVPVNSTAEINELFRKGNKNRNNNTNEFGRLSAKSSACMVFDLVQSTELIDTRENIVTISRMYLWDLPACDVLEEDPETLAIKQGPTLNKAIVSVSTLIRNLSDPSSKGHVFYENSAVTSLLRDSLGGNSFSCFIFTVQYGDMKGSSITLNHMKLSRKIMNFPVVNEGKTIGLLKKLRSEINQALFNVASVNNQNYEGYNVKLADLEKKVIEENLGRMKDSEDKQKLAKQISEIREKYNNLVRNKADLQTELIKTEEEKLQISKALVELQIENTKLMEIIQNEKYDANNKMINQEYDILSLGVREEKAMEAVQELQDKLREILDEKKSIEIEFVAVKKNFIQTNLELDEEKLKNQNLGLELINAVNENKGLQEELNLAFGSKNSLASEGQSYKLQLDKFKKDYEETREALLMAKAEIERLKTELLKYDVSDQRARLEMKQKELEMERGFIEHTKEKQGELAKLTNEAESNFLRNKDDRLVWESQKIELTQKNRNMTRRLQELEERMRELKSQNEGLLATNQKITLEIDQIRSVYRSTLMKYMQEGLNMKDHPDVNKTMGLTLNAREELIRSYTEKEVELLERSEKDKKTINELKLEIRALKYYARDLKYLAEDWAPIEKNLPPILVQPPPVKLEDDHVNDVQRRTEEECEKLRKRNRQLQEELKMIQDQILNHGAVSLKNAFAPGTGRQETQEKKGFNYEYGGDAAGMEELKRERVELQEEVRRLFTLLKDNKKYDIYVLQKENERLIKMIKEFEGGYAAAPGSGDSRSAQQKKTLKQLEKEKTSLEMRAFNAEEQLKSMEDRYARASKEHQKQILQLKKQLKGDFS